LHFDHCVEAEKINLKQEDRPMMLGYRNSRHPLNQLRGEMDRLLTGFLGAVPEGFVPSAFRSQPAANVWEQGDALLVEMELPGVKNDQIDIAVAGDEMTVKIERPEIEREGVTFHRRERPVGSFTRVLRLPVEVDAGKVEAQLRDGVLTITLPKTEAAKPRKINVATT
jgi:HSP20 family protein